MLKIGPKSLIFGRPDATDQAWWHHDTLKAPASLEAAAKPLAFEHDCRASWCPNLVANEVVSHID